MCEIWSSQLLHLLVESEASLSDKFLDIATSLLLQLVHNHKRDLLDKRVLSQNCGLVIQTVDTLVETGLVSAGKCFAGLSLSLDLLLQIRHVDQKLIDAFRVLTQHLFLEVGSIFVLRAIHLQLEPAV